MTCSACLEPIEDGPLVGIGWDRETTCTAALCAACVLGAEDVDALLVSHGAKDYGWVE